SKRTKASRMKSSRTKPAGAKSSRAKSSRTKSSPAKVEAHRARLRRQGLRPIQIWVPDMRAPNFRAEAHLQSLAVAAGTRADEDQAFIDAISALGNGE